ncbi:carbohydrate ABC transporter permease [Deinococcus ruber]|uniref:ABC transporter n=1 Tax=Deinococcus ruber TaxID=1848197 RepID=A0A918CK59_9DEIO|nr:sugar ABC transporter permease [Deinococcus ruber]GGR28294.1 ABC transporter [Deinococcus ruber]
MSLISKPHTAAPTRTRLHQRQDWTAAAFIAPAMVVLALFLLYPLVANFRLSFVNWNGLGNTARDVGLSNWLDLSRDAVFLRALGNNALLAVFSILIQLPLGLLLAVTLSRASRGSVALRIIYVLPLLMSSVAIGTVFRDLYDPNFGAINTALRSLHLDGLAQDWLGDPRFALASVIAVVCWQSVPFYMLLFMAGLSSMPDELREAATLDGASPRVIFWRITLPFLQGTVRTAAVLSLIGSLRYFDLVYVMTGGGPSGSSEVMATYMYRTVFSAFNIGYGAAVSSAMFLIVVVAASAALRLSRRYQTEV